MSRKTWKLSNYDSMSREKKFLQQRDFHKSQLLLALDTHPVEWETWRVDIVEKALSWLDEKNGSRPVKGFEYVRGQLVHAKQYQRLKHS